MNTFIPAYIRLIYSYRPHPVFFDTMRKRPRSESAGDGCFTASSTSSYSVWITFESIMFSITRLNIQWGTQRVVFSRRWAILVGIAHSGLEKAHSGAYSGRCDEHSIGVPLPVLASSPIPSAQCDRTGTRSLYSNCTFKKMFCLMRCGCVTNIVLFIDVSEN